MRRTARVTIEENDQLRSPDATGGTWILRLGLNRIIGSCDMRWVNLYDYKGIKGSGTTHKIIGDLDEKES